MINRRFLLNSILLVALVAGGAYVLMRGGDMPVSDSGNDDAVELAAGIPVPVKIADFSYSPKELKIPVGTKVIWKNEDSTKHNILADDGGFGSKLLSKGEIFEFTFDKIGSFPYHCGPHPWMKAAVIVE